MLCYAKIHFLHNHLSQNFYRSLRYYYLIQGIKVLDMVYTIHVNKIHESVSWKATTDYLLLGKIAMVMPHFPVNNSTLPWLHLLGQQTESRKSLNIFWQRGC